MWWRRGGDAKCMQKVIEGHFWSLTRYRIGRRFIGLDYADNVIFFPAYRSKKWGGWTAVTLGVTSSSSFLTNDTSVVNVLEDGYPLHWRANSKLKEFIKEEKRVWRARLKEEAEGFTAEKVMENSGESTADGSSKERGDMMDGIDSEHRFRDALAIKCTSPGFALRHLRVSRIKTSLYKFLYFYLWGIAISLVVQAYLLFRGWLNPPARQGLKNIEAHVLHVPKLIFGFCVSCVVWAAKHLQPVASPLLKALEGAFPQVNWSAASPETLANRAQLFAGLEVKAGAHEADPSHQRMVRREFDPASGGWATVWNDQFTSLMQGLILLFTALLFIF